MRSLKIVSLLALLGWSLQSNAIVIGTADPATGNCYPFGCDSGWEPVYQQVYDASYFGASIDIESLTFYNTEFDSGDTMPNSGTYTFTLSTTSAAVDGLSVTASDNYGADNATVYTGSLPTEVLFGGAMDIILDSLFSYDPTEGNLLLSIMATGLDDNGGSMFFDMANSETDGMSRMFRDATDSRGLITGFNEADRTSIPEPASLALLGLGLIGLGAARRRK